MKRILLFVFLIYGGKTMAGETDALSLKKGVLLYASFDEKVQADRGQGGLSFSTRTNHATEKDRFQFENGFDPKVFRVAKDRGVHGGALEAVDVLANNGRIFLPARGNLAFKDGGWGGAVSVWINTDPDRLLKTTFCDPIQITQKGANNGGIWFDFNNDKPRALRMGVFPAAKDGDKTIAENDPDAPLLPVPKPGLKVGEWHHFVLSWENLDTHRKDARAALYIDGKKFGEIKDRDLAMRWDMDRTGIYVAVNFIGLLDELATFDRALTQAEVNLLFRTPGLLAQPK